MLAEAGLRMMFDAHGHARHFEVLQPQNGQPSEKLGHLGIVHPRHHADSRWPRACSNT